ncbi:MAG: phosphopyruvate hydratase [Alphaproteobacteria bacterium]|jgi:enolase|tara:strand:+ start:14 stop:1294 length:1281 start_codon:yes stop_codon:yes gene_type:complete
MSAIRNIFAREIVDSRGTPTVEVEVSLEKLSSLASVPSGASTGTYEAYELRDEDKNRFFGKGVTKAVDLINSEINETIQGMKITDQSLIDKTLVNLDGTHNKSRLGANSILAVSLACAKTAAKFLNLPLFSYIGGISTSLPTPLMNIINGGCHSNNKLDFQEFMIIPLGFSSFKDALRAGCEVFHCLKNLLNKNSFSISVGDEGGFAPDFSSNKQCLDFIINAIEKSGYKPGQEIYIGLDVASSEFFDGKKYKLASESLELSSQDIVRYYQNLIENYPIISIEDGLDENDWDGWSLMTQEIGRKCQLVGDDLFVTSTERLKTGLDKKSGNSILIKLNQIGTLTETIETINLAKKNNFNTIISHRSGETEDTFISDLSVGIDSGQIKTGSLSRSERISKYNQLLRIEDRNPSIKFSGNIPFKKFLNV